MKRAVAAGLGMALAVELAGCGSSGPENRPSLPSRICVHAMGNVVLNYQDQTSILNGQNIVSLHPLEIKPADAILIEAAEGTSPTQLKRDDQVVMSLHKYIKAKPTATVERRVDTAVQGTDLKITVLEKRPDKSCEVKTSTSPKVVA